MDITNLSLGEGRERSKWVKLRTLLRVRWVAIIGQSIAMIVAVQIYGLQVQTSFAVLAIAFSVVTNIYFSTVYPETRRLSEPEALAMLIIDLSQLSFLLYMTGGLSNPFAILILAPVTIAATALQLRSTLTLGMVAITFISLLSQFSMPILSADGTALLFLPRNLPWPANKN